MREVALALTLMGTGCGASVAQEPLPDAGSSTDAASEAGDAFADACPFPLVACASGCVNLQSDSNNCDGCGRGCASTQECVQGVCATPCTGAGHALCRGSCVDEDTDATNCGSCGHVCETIQICSAGTCVDDPCTPYGTCPECIPNAACGWCVTTQACQSTSKSGTCDIWSYGTC